MTDTPFTVAVAQLASNPLDALASAHKAAAAIREAAARDARLVVFPEAFLGGYPKGARFGAPVGLRTPEGRDAFWDGRRLSEEWRGPGRVWLITGRPPQLSVVAGLADAELVAAGGGRRLYVNRVP